LPRLYAEESEFVEFMDGAVKLPKVPFLPRLEIYAQTCHLSEAVIDRLIATQTKHVIIMKNKMNQICYLMLSYLPGNKQEP